MEGVSGSPDLNLGFRHGNPNCSFAEASNPLTFHTTWDHSSRVHKCDRNRVELHIQTCRIGRICSDRDVQREAAGEWQRRG
jgi:hypothetical protein